MRTTGIVALGLASLATALPSSELQRRQGGSTANDLTSGECKAVTLVFARGTTEPGNMGSVVAGPLVRELKKAIPSLAVQGVKYAAGVATNMGPGGADAQGVSEANRLLKLAASKCPQTVIIAGGYSQGAAVMHGAAKSLPPDVVSKLAGIALFGDTQNAQSGGHIRGLATDKSKVFCNAGDGVCSGALAVNGAHMSYAKGDGKLKEGADWLISQVRKMKPSAVGGSAAGAAPEASAAAAGAGGKGSGGAPAKGAKGGMPKGGAPH